MSTADPAALRGVAEEGARLAAAVLRRHADRLAEGADLDVDTKSSSTDPVSVADAESEAALVAFLERVRPDDGLLGEEGADRRGRTGLRWVLDPLDGTVNFLYGHPGWAVSVAVERQDPDGEWQAVAGAVLDPLRDELFAADLDGPALRDGREVRVSDPVPLAQALVATGFSYDRDHRVAQARTAAAVLAQARDLRRVGSAALDLCGVACGRVDGYYEDTTQRWDWAAGALIARQAGAVVTPLANRSGVSGVVAAGPALHPVLDALVRDPGWVPDQTAARP